MTRAHRQGLCPVLAAIRAAFDRRVAEHATEDGGLDMPISVKGGRWLPGTDQHA